MMLAWSTCEPPNGYGVTNCSSLSGNALAALVSAKAAAAVVASEVIDRRVVMISLFATTFLRSPRHRRRLALGNRQVPSLEVGDVLHLLRCCHAVQRIAWTRTDHVPFATTLPIPTARHASQRPETRLPHTTANFRTWPRRCAPRFPAAPEIQPPIHRAETDDFENLSAREQLLPRPRPASRRVARPLLSGLPRQNCDHARTSVYGGAIGPLHRLLWSAVSYPHPRLRADHCSAPSRHAGSGSWHSQKRVYAQAPNVRIGSCVTSIAMSPGEAQLYER